MKYRYIFSSLHVKTRGKRKTPAVTTQTFLSQQQCVSIDVWPSFFTRRLHKSIYQLRLSFYFDESHFRHSWIVFLRYFWHNIILIQSLLNRFSFRWFTALSQATAKLQIMWASKSTNIYSLEIYNMQQVQGKSKNCDTWHHSPWTICHKKAVHIIANEEI